MFELNRGMKSYSGDVIDQTLHSPFDIETHKNVFVNYLEVIIDQEGVVHYAVPSHQEWLINKAIVVLGLSSREELYDECPDEYALSPMEWLTEVTGCVSVWDDHFIGNPTNKQIKTMRELKDASIYRGEIPLTKIEFQNMSDKMPELLVDSSSYPGIIHSPILPNKTIATITICGCIHFDIKDDMDFIKPTPEQIKNLHDLFCIDVKLNEEEI